MKRIFQISLFLLIFIPRWADAQNDWNSFFLKGKALYETGNYDSALIFLGKAEVANNRLADINLYKGYALFKKSQYRMALNEFEIVEKSGKGKASFWIAKCYARLDEPGKTIGALEVHLNSNYRLPESVILLDPDISLLENNREFIEFWKNGNWYSGYDQVLAEADYLIKTRKYPEAIEVLSEGIRKGYRNAPLYEKRADVYRKTGNLKLALDDLNHSIESSKSDPDIIADRALLYYLDGKYKNSVEDYNAAIKLNPLELKYYLGRSISLQKTGSFEESVNNMKYYLSYYPGNDTAWYHLGMTYFEQNDYLGAITCLNNSLKLNPKDYRFFSARGQCYLKTKTYQYAWKDFSMALDLNPRDSKSFVFKGIAAINLGDMDDGCFCFEMAKKLGDKDGFEYSDRYCR